VRLLLLASIVVVVVVVALEDLLAQFLLTLVDIRVEFVAVLADREFLVVVNRDHDLARANGLVVRVVELGHVGVAKSLVRRKAFGRVKLK
jgi:hypothetical protein